MKDESKLPIKFDLTTQLEILREENEQMEESFNQIIAHPYSQKSKEESFNQIDSHSRSQRSMSIRSGSRHSSTHQTALQELLISKYGNSDYSSVQTLDLGGHQLKSVIEMQSLLPQILSINLYDIIISIKCLNI